MFYFFSIYRTHFFFKDCIACTFQVARREIAVAIERMSVDGDHFEYMVALRVTRDPSAPLNRHSVTAPARVVKFKMVLILLLLFFFFFFVRSSPFIFSPADPSASLSLSLSNFLSL